MAKRKKKATKARVSPAQKRMFDVLVRNGMPVPRARIGSAVGMGESGGKKTALNVNSNGSWDFGAWQINEINGIPKSKLRTWDQQAKATIEISNNGTNWSPWVAYTNGSYKKYLAGTESLTKAGAKSGGKKGGGGSAPVAGGTTAAIDRTPEQTAALASFQGGLPGTTLASNPLGDVLGAAGNALDPLGTGWDALKGLNDATGGIGGSLLNVALPQQVEDFFRLFDRLFEIEFWYGVGKVLLGLGAVIFGVNMLMKISTGTSPIGAAKKGATTAAAFAATKGVG